jgi:hypothetical protein
MPILGNVVKFVISTLGNRCIVGNHCWDLGLETFLEMSCIIPESFRKVPKSVK